MSSRVWRHRPVRGGFAFESVDQRSGKRCEPIVVPIPDHVPDRSGLANKLLVVIAEHHGDRFVTDFAPGLRRAG